MSTQLIRIDPLSPDAGLVRLAAEAILAGGLVAIPTETAYGLAQSPRMKSEPQTSLTRGNGHCPPVLRTETRSARRRVKDGARARRGERRPSLR